MNNTTQTVLDEATRLPSPPPSVVGATKCVIGVVGGGGQCVVPTLVPPTLVQAKLRMCEVGGWLRWLWLGLHEPRRLRLTMGCIKTLSYVVVAQDLERGGWGAWPQNE